MGNFEYAMPREMAKMILDKKDKKGDIQKTLCVYVNEQLGLLGTCIGVKLI